MHWHQCAARLWGCVSTSVCAYRRSLRDGPRRSRLHVQLPLLLSRKQRVKLRCRKLISEVKTQTAVSESFPPVRHSFLKPSGPLLTLLPNVVFFCDCCFFFFFYTSVWFNLSNCILDERHCCVKISTLIHSFDFLMWLLIWWVITLQIEVIICLSESLPNLNHRFQYENVGMDPIIAVN